MKLVLFLLSLVVAGCSTTGNTQDSVLRPDFPPRGTYIGGSMNPEITHLGELRAHVAGLDYYKHTMDTALELHDAGKIKEARELVEKLAFLMPDQRAMAWMSEQLADGESIPGGGYFKFVNQSDKPIDKVTLRFRSHKVIAENLKPNETRRIYSDRIPKGSVRLWIDVDREDDWGHKLGGRNFLSGRFAGTKYGFTKDVIITPEGRASFGD